MSVSPELSDFGGSAFRTSSPEARKVFGDQRFSLSLNFLKALSIRKANNFEIMFLLEIKPHCKRYVEIRLTI